MDVRQCTVEEELNSQRRVWKGISFHPCEDVMDVVENAWILSGSRGWDDACC